jgi:hypothetical protein
MPLRRHGHQKQREDAGEYVRRQDRAPCGQGKADHSEAEQRERSQREIENGRQNQRQAKDQPTCQEQPAIRAEPIRKRKAKGRRTPSRYEIGQGGAQE